MTDFNVLSAFVVGLLGSGHCLSMCGGITTMLTSALSASSHTKKFILSLYYNLGRLSTYAIIGASVAASSNFIVQQLGFPVTALRFVAAIFLILLGLYLGQWLMWLTHVEKVGRHIWRILSPISKKLLPVTHAKQAFLLGGLWGWLPCGLVYSTLTWALASGSAVDGALIMAAFGLGTLPAMLSMSIGITRLQKLIRHQVFRKISAISLIIYGIYTLAIASELMF